jgi:hypothetical protein
VCQQADVGYVNSVDLHPWPSQSSYLLKEKVPFTNFTERSRENTGSFVTSTRIVTIAANSHTLHYAIFPVMGTHFTTIPGIAFGSVEGNIDI